MFLKVMVFVVLWCAGIIGTEMFMVADWDNILWRDTLIDCALSAGAVICFYLLFLKDCLTEPKE